MTLCLIMMHHHTRFSDTRLSSSEYTFWPKPNIKTHTQWAQYKNVSQWKKAWRERRPTAIIFAMRFLQKVMPCGTDWAVTCFPCTSTLSPCSNKRSRSSLSHRWALFTGEMAFTGVFTARWRSNLVFFICRQDFFTAALLQYLAE